jgi:hypothetical protein
MAPLVMEDADESLDFLEQDNTWERQGTQDSTDSKDSKDSKNSKDSKGSTGSTRSTCSTCSTVYRQRLVQFADAVSTGKPSRQKEMWHISHVDANPQDKAWGDHTTVVLRNIPRKYTQDELMSEINGAGFQGCFDFLYIPMDLRSRVNAGFAVCNFGGRATAARFRETFHGKTLGTCPSDEVVIEVSPADVQGFQGNAKLYMSEQASAGRWASAGSTNRPLFIV